MVKANAYGLGSKKICKTLNFIADYFAVSSKEEFLEIKNLTKKPILLLDPIYENITKLAIAGCELCVSNKDQLQMIYLEAMSNRSVVYKIHIAVNTGMNRFGFVDFNSILFKKS